MQLRKDDSLIRCVNMTVNGTAVQVTVQPLNRLSEVLRDQLKLTGTKVGCHAGDCGACTVLIDGEQVCSCLQAIAQCEGRNITTVEGLATDIGAPSELQQAFVAHGAAQCGICTPGMLMAAQDLLLHHPSPSREQVLDGLAGVLCRCTGYQKIVEAILSVAGMRRLGATSTKIAVSCNTAEPGAAVGARLERLDAVSKVTTA